MTATNSTYVPEPTPEWVYWMWNHIGDVFMMILGALIIIMVIIIVYEKWRKK